MTFEEFLEAADEPLYTYYTSIVSDRPIESIFHNRLLDFYNLYLIIGGMPECVSEWILAKDPAEIDRIQGELVELYENDFSKHNGRVNSGRILLTFRSIVTQLVKDNEIFLYGCVKEGARIIPI